MDDIPVEDPKFDEIVNIETSAHITSVDQSKRAKSSGRHEGLVYHRITPVNVHVIIPKSRH